eukprot:8000564-Pyramimonas_sp.AAC.1
MGPQVAGHVVADCWRHSPSEYAHPQWLLALRDLRKPLAIRGEAAEEPEALVVWQGRHVATALRVLSRRKGA